MGGRRIIVRWMSPDPGGSRVFSVPLAVVLAAGMLLVLSWLSLGLGAYLVTRLYYDNRRLEVENAQLQEQATQLDEMRALVKSIEKDGKVIRGFLGVEKRQEGGGGKGQGGFAADDQLPQLTGDEAPRTRTLIATENYSSSSLLEQTRRLKENLRELLQAMREQRDRLDHTPSIVPVDSETYCFSSGFGWRQSPFTGQREFHSGLDISDSEGTPIIAPANGVVLEAGSSKYMGRYLKLDHGRGCTTSYSHLSRFNVKPGDKVKRGQVLGLMGNTGNSSGPHVHYRIEVDEKMVNPRTYILNSVAPMGTAKPLSP
ncbi:MAG TPA: M23 family metallopeptidase [Syntrophobacteria bacterium]|nr:M23 family metallopeptidase [Syntrophobacteria bacterium]